MTTGGVAGPRSERVILVGMRRPRQPPSEVEEHLEELARLTATAREELRSGLVIFDEDLTPAQLRNLERALEVTVLDRAGLILDIFARRAKSREAKVQVELAQLRYLLPRLTRRWSHLERQVGGIGVRGVGETQLETDRRLIQKRIAHLVSDLRQIERERPQRRKRRKGTIQVALVGYP